MRPTKVKIIIRLPSRSSACYPGRMGKVDTDRAAGTGEPYADGETVQPTTDEFGRQVVVLAGGSSGGDASAALQQEQIDLLSDIYGEYAGLAKDASVAAVTAAIEALGGGASNQQILTELGVHGDALNTMASRLDVALSTRASEATADRTADAVEAIQAQTPTLDGDGRVPVALDPTATVAVAPDGPFEVKQGLPGDNSGYSWWTRLHDPITGENLTIRPAGVSAGPSDTSVIVRNAQGIRVGAADVSNANPVPVSDAGASITTDSPQLPSALVGGRLAVDGSGVTQPVSAASLPLPTGAATNASVDDLEPDVDATRIAAQSVDAKTPALEAVSTVSGQPRHVPVTSIAYVTHDPSAMQSYGGTAAGHRRCDFDFTGGGTIEYLPARRAVRLAVAGTNGLRSTYRGRMWNPYIPGSTQRVKFSALFDSARSNQETRVGMFDDSDGVFVLQTNSGMSLVVRSSVSGSVVETTTAIANFDPTLDHACEIAYQWPAGRVEFWVDGSRLLNISKAGGAVPWMRRPNLPFTADIRNVGTSSAGFVDLIQFLVEAEGEGMLPRNSANVSSTVSSIPTGGKLLIQSRVKQTIDIGTITGIDNRGVYIPGRIAVDTTTGPMVVKVYANGTVTGSPSWTAGAIDPGLEYDTAGVFTGATGLFLASGTIDTTTGSVEIDLGEALLEAFTVTSGAFNGAETVQVVGFARSGTVSSANTTIHSLRMG